MASINRGDNTGAFGNEFLRIYLNNPNQLYIQKAVVQINGGDLYKEFYDPTFPLTVNFTGEETELLHQINVCKLALWDEYGRRRTAEGKFTFFVKETRIKDPDEPVQNIPEIQAENDITFDLTDAEFVAQFTINATPSKMSELIQDIEVMTPENIKAGENTRVYYDGKDVYISANPGLSVSYNDLQNKPSINGTTVIGNIEIDLPTQSDWNEKDQTDIAYIKNKPELADVATSGLYSDLEGTPTIPTKVSDLQNDTGFITGDNYYTKAQVDELVSGEIDLRPVYERIEQVENKEIQDISEINEQLENKVSENELSLQVNALNAEDQRLEGLINDEVSSINTQLQDKATKAELEELEGYVTSVVTEDDLNNALEAKANKTDIGNGKLTISRNNIEKGNFTANSKNNVSINIDVPTKLSDLDNDQDFVTRDEIDLDNYITLPQLNDRLSDKANSSDIGTGILTLKTNGDTLGTFDANAKSNKTLDIVIPQNLSDLNQDIDYLVESDLSALNEQITALNTAIDETIPARLDSIDSALDNKVDFSATKSMVDNTEINRLKNVDNYDDTQLRDQINSLETVVDTFDGAIDNKVDKIEGKGLSTNDFTTSYKDKVDSTYLTANATASTVSSLVNTVFDHTNSIQGLAEDVSGLQVSLSDESIARLNEDNRLQASIEALEAKSTVLDIVANKAELNQYPTTDLKINDVICVLKDETENDCVTYYRWYEDPIDHTMYWKLIGSEGTYYTKSESDDRYVNRYLEINGHALTANVELSASDVGAIPNTEHINDGLLIFKVNNVELPQTMRFSANQEDTTVVEIEVPTKTSQLTNDEQFVPVDVLVQTYLGRPSEAYGDGDNTLLWDKAYYLEDMIDANSTRIDVLEGNLPRVALTGDYNDLLNKPTIPRYTSQLANDCDFITMDSIDLSAYALKTEIPTAVSQLENDRGYITTNGLGRGELSIFLQDTELGTFNANSKEDKSITIPVDTALSTQSTNLIQNKVVTTELNKKAVDSTVVHLTLSETITGTKTFNDIIVPTQSTSDNSTKAASTAFVKNQGYAKDSTVAHLDLSETITGDKTFSGTSAFTGSVVLSQATGVTVNNNDNSTKLATTAFVKNQGYAVDSNVVHDGGDETINGNKTFAETTTFQGITYLGDYAHVGTPDGNTQDAVVNVAYLQSVINALIQRIEVLEGYHS